MFMFGIEINSMDSVYLPILSSGPQVFDIVMKVTKLNYGIFI